MNSTSPAGIAPTNPAQEPSFVAKLFMGVTQSVIFGYVRHKFTAEKGADATPDILLFSGMTVFRIVLEQTHTIALKIIGERSKYQNATTDNKTNLDVFRVRCWKVISIIETPIVRIDEVFSGIVKIRPERELKKLQIKDKDLKFLEVVRRILVNNSLESGANIVSLYSSIYVVTALGYTPTAMPFLVSMYTMSFALQSLMGIQMHYERLELEQLRTQNA